MAGSEKPNSQHNGAVPDGKLIAGYYVDQAQTHGYIMDNGNFVTFDVPESTATLPFDVNPAGNVVVGSYTDESQKSHGFVAQRRGSAERDWQFTTIEVPGATETRIYGTNAGGDLAGRYASTDGKWHGFVARRIEP